jgi:uncharacterized repeat protein (TIGR01451 family)
MVPLRSTLFQPLEERLMLDIGGANSLPPTIVVGRTLSAYDLPDVQNNQETLTFTVYNQAEHPISSVLLTDSLESGVTFASASQLPDQNGQDLAWSLGTIQPYDRASVTLTVSLANPTPTQLDTGASAYGTLDAGMVTWTTAPATLRTSAIAGNLLASTPDANTTDPYVQEKAAELNYDPTQIYNFLHNDIGYNSYSGSLRGARGTLWSNAGNSLDDASLGVALMRASGIPAQYEQGALSQSQAQQLILSMFPASYQTVGYIPAGTQTSDPANNSQLLSETENHFWFQFDSGSGMQDADPEFTGQSVGQSTTTSTGSFTEVPQSLRQTTEVSLTAEIYNQAAAALTGGNGLTETVVLDQTFNDVSLVGHPLTIGNVVTQSGLGGTFSSVTNTYTPYIELGDEAFGSTSQDTFIQGTEYQELLTSFPLGSEILTGLFLNVTTSGPTGPAQTSEHTLVDRIGYAARQGLAPVGQISVDPTAPPVLTPLDFVTLYVLPGLDNPSFPGLAPELASAAARQLTLAQAEPASANTAVQQSDLTKATAGAAIAMTRLLGSAFFALADSTAEQIAEQSLVQAYYDSPRLVLISNWEQIDPQTKTATLSVAFDLMQDSIRAIAFPGQSSQAATAFQATRGVSESFAETEVPEAFLGSATSAATVLSEAFALGIPLTTIDAHNLSRLDSLSISDEAKARITAAVAQGKVVIVPTTEVPLAGTPTIAWYQVDPVSGEAIGVNEDGTHGEQGLPVDPFALVLLGVFALIVGIAYFNQGGTLPTVEVPNIAEAIKHSKLVQKNKTNYESPAFQLNDIAKFVSGQSLSPYLDEIQSYLMSTTVGQASGLANLGPQFTGLLSAALGVSVTAAPTAIPLSNPTPSPPFGRNQSSADLPLASNLTGGALSANLQSASLTVSGQLNASWSTAATTSMDVTGINTPDATVRDANGNVVGTGALILNDAVQLPVAATSAAYSIAGQGSLSAYSGATSNLVSADWTSYSAALSGGATLNVTSGSLSLNGTILPAGTYTISANSISLTGSGQTASPDFSGPLTVQAHDANVQVGPSSGAASLAGAAIPTASGFTLDGVDGSITVSAGGATEAITLTGTGSNLLALATTHSALTTDENHAVSFQINQLITESNTYHTDVFAPSGWTASISPTGLVTLAPPPDLQSGTFPVRVTSTILSQPTFIAATTVNVTINSTTPGLTFKVNPDPVFTVPFDNAQVPSAYRAMVQNTGPKADTYNLTFSNVPTGWAILDSGRSDTVPAGATGILGIYLEPTGTTLPAPGTQVSFTVTATSTTDPSITQTVNVSFTMPAIAAATVTSNPLAVSTTPGTPTTTTITITNVGNVPYNAALATTTDSGLTISGLSSPGMIPVGQSVTETATLTPEASTALNSTLNATVNVDQAAAQNEVSVVAVRATSINSAQSPHPSPLPEGEGDAAAGQTVDVSADVQSEVSQQADRVHVDLGASDAVEHRRTRRD